MSQDLIMNKNEYNKSASDFDVKSETLDYLYTEQLTELRNLILKNIDFNDIEICRKWLKKFNTTTTTEKLARNCLCTLMQEQIKENNCLSEPFTNTANYEKKLENILKELDEQMNTAYNNNKSDSQFDLNLFEVTDECRDNELSIRAGELQQQLQILRLQLTDKTIENLKLKEIAEKYCLEKERNEAQLDNMKKTILDGIRKRLLCMEQIGIHSQQPLFSDIFRIYENDKEFMQILKHYDSEFYHMLSNYFRREFEKRKNLIARHISKQYAKSKSKLREKYERNMKLQTRLIKLSCLSTLRLICIESHREFEKLDMWGILQSLEEKYQNILNISHNNTHLGI